MKKTFFLLFLCSAAPFAAAASDTALTPEAGPHAVGLRIVQQYDYSRTLDATVDAFGKAKPGPPARPMQTFVWYPARRSNAAPMSIADYHQAILTDVNFALPAAEAARQRAGWLAGPRKAPYSAATLAVRDAPAAGGAYPVVIYAPSFASSAQENLDLCEYLASHGYVVLASRSLGARAVNMTDDIDGIEAQAADIGFLANYAQTLPQADISQMAAAGYSWGGMANVFAAARSGRIKALVSMDGSIRYFPKMWSAATYVRPERTNVPLLFLGDRGRTPEEMERDDKMGPNYLNRMKYSDVYITTMYPMSHRHFSGWNLRFADERAFGDYQRADVLQAYRSGVLYIHKFLDAYLKKDAAALAFMKQSPLKNGIAPQVMAMRHAPAQLKVMDEAEFLRTFAGAGFKDAQAIHASMRGASPEFKLSPFNLNILGYELLRGKNARGAVELFKLATHIEPRYGNAFDSEGEAYEALGDTALAIAAYEKAVAVDKGQSNAIARIKALRGGGAGSSGASQ